MVEFLDRAYNQANEELALLATYKSDKKKSTDGKPPPKVFATDVKKTDENESELADSSREKSRKRSEDFCGKCPLCGNLHTWTRKGGDKWPSDRFLSCKKFNDLS